MCDSNVYDVVELSAILQSLGFTEKSIDIIDDINSSQNSTTRTVTINCQYSGLQVVLESGNMMCSCPSNAKQQNSGFWEVSGMTGGKQVNKERGSALLATLTGIHREQLATKMQEILRYIKEHNQSNVNKSKGREDGSNRSASMIELKTPEKRLFQKKSDTPKRYRSLDTLTGYKQRSETLPTPGILHSIENQVTMDDIIAQKKVLSMCKRQSTYTVSSTSGSMRRNSKTSSPIEAPPSKSVLESLRCAEKAAEELLNKLSTIVREITEDGKHDSSMSSLVLDVSKISVLKGGEYSKLQFASSPNLSGLDTVQENFCTRIKKGESASTSNLASTKTMAKSSNTSRLRKISPNIFRFKRDSSSTSKLEKLKNEDTKNSKLTNLLKSKPVIQARTSKSTTDASPNISASRKKFSHIKSTIPKPISKKD